MNVPFLPLLLSKSARRRLLATCLHCMRDLLGHLLQWEMAVRMRCSSMSWSSARRRDTTLVFKSTIVFTTKGSETARDVLLDIP